MNPFRERTQKKERMEAITQKQAREQSRFDSAVLAFEASSARDHLDEFTELTDKNGPAFVLPDGRFVSIGDALQYTSEIEVRSFVFGEAKPDATGVSYDAKEIPFACTKDEAAPGAVFDPKILIVDLRLRLHMIG